MLDHGPEPLYAPPTWAMLHEALSLEPSSES